MEVEIISFTNNAIDTIYLACRQCYFKGSIIDEQEELLKKPYDQKIDLIQKVMKSGHTSTIEHASFTFAIKDISRTCSHQLVRHRIASPSQQSQRYAGIGEDQEEYYITPKFETIEDFEKYHDHLAASKKLYGELVKSGNKMENARFALPEGTKTNIVITMNFRSLLHFFEERLCTCAQWELRYVANAMFKEAQKLVPGIFDLAGPKCKRLGYCNESKERSCGIKPTRDKIYRKVGDEYVPLFD